MWTRISSVHYRRYAGSATKSVELMAQLNGSGYGKRAVGSGYEGVASTANKNSKVSASKKMERESDSDKNQNSAKEMPDVRDKQPGLTKTEQKKSITLGSIKSSIVKLLSNEDAKLKGAESDKKRKVSKFDEVNHIPESDKTKKVSNSDEVEKVKKSRDQHLPDQMTREGKRALYHKNVKGVTLKAINSWDVDTDCKYPNEMTQVKNEEINKKVSVWQGDITQLEINAIVNVANESLRGGAIGSN